MATDSDSRKLSDLRVIDLKVELEKRGLDKTGVKATLMERLAKALRDEGFDPDVYQFECDKKNTKRASTSTGASMTEEDPNEISNVAEDPECEPMDVDQSFTSIIEAENLANLKNENENTGDEEPTSEISDNIKSTDEGKTNEPIKHDTDKSNQTVISTTAANKENVTIQEKNDNKEAQDEMAEKSNSEQTEIPDKRLSNADCTRDTESPINLTIEEEEENLVLNDEGLEASNTGENKQDKRGATKETSTTPAEEKEEKAAEKSLENASAADGIPPKESSPAKANGQSAEKTSSKDKNDKYGTGRNLWVTNITQNTRANELKQVLSQFGKVVGAKVVTNARYPGARCYGYVTMETAADANNCIEKLNNTELNGQIICVEKVKPDQPVSLLFKGDKKRDDKDKPKPKSQRKSPIRAPTKERNDKSKDASKENDDVKKAEGKKTEEDKDNDGKEKSKKEGDKDGNEVVEAHGKSTSKERDRHGSRHSRESGRRGRSRSRGRSSNGRHRSRDGSRKRHEILTFDKIREERERQKYREKERLHREEQRRRREEIERQREIEHRHREESMRLERERAKLRAEREKIEREKLELMRMEREQQRKERETLEQEKIELQRAKMRLEARNRQPIKRPASNYRGEPSYEDRKRIATERHFQEEAPPPPPRFDAPMKGPRDASSPPMKKSFGTNKEYGNKPNPRLPYLKHDREFDSERPMHQSPMIRLSTNSPKYDANSVFSMNRESRDPRKGGQIMNDSSKDSRFADRTTDRSPGHYRTVRDERDRRPMSDHKQTDMRSREHGRYDPKSKEPNRFERNSSNWHSGSSNSKVFVSGGPGGSAGSRDNWNKGESWRPTDSQSNERWTGSGSSSRVGMPSSSNNTIFGGNSSNINNLGVSCPPPPGINNYNAERFDSYKSSLANMRKY